MNEPVLTTPVDTECLETLHRILRTRSENDPDHSSRFAYKSALDMLDYALAGKIDCLAQFDHE